MKLPWWLSGKESSCQCRFHPWVRKILWRRKCEPTAVFLPGKSHRQRCLVGLHLLGCKVKCDLAAKLQQPEGLFFPPIFIGCLWWLSTQYIFPKEYLRKQNSLFPQVEADSKQIYDTVTPEGVWVLCVVYFTLTVAGYRHCYSIVLTTDPVLKNRPLLPLTLLFLGFLL